MDSLLPKLISLIKHKVDIFNTHYWASQPAIALLPAYRGKSVFIYGVCLFIVLSVCHSPLTFPQSCPL